MLVHSGEKISSIPEIMLAIMNLLQFDSLVQISHTNCENRNRTQHIIRTRIHNLFNGFIPNQRIRDFFNLVQATNTAITGPLMLMILDPFKFHTPRSSALSTTLHIVIPKGSTLIWIELWRTLGFTCNGREDNQMSDEPRNNQAKSITVLKSSIVSIVSVQFKTWIK